MGDTVTYTLDYVVQNGPVHNGIITDVLPDGVTYVNGSASSDAQFTFIDFNVTTPGALTWKAATVSANGTLTYKVTIDEDAADLEQPLVNTATIDSDETEPGSSTSRVFAAPPVQAETSVPTAPGATSAAGRRTPPRAAASCWPSWAWPGSPWPWCSSPRPRPRSESALNR